MHLRLEFKLIIKGEANFISSFIPDLDSDNLIHDELKKNGFENDFEIIDFIYNKTPNDINFWNNSKDIRTNAILLKIKSTIVMNHYDKVCYKFNLNHIRGFQYCNPEMCSKTMTQIFTSDNNEFLMITKGLSQQDIDYMLRLLNKEYSRYNEIR